MELTTATTPIPDPFFAAVRRRHPDVDVVLLPPPAPQAAVDPVTDDGVAATLAGVATEARLLWSAVAADDSERPDARLEFGADPSRVRAVARLATRRDDGSALLVRLRDELAGRGWEVRRAPRGAVDRLTGALDGLQVTASYAEGSGALLLTLSSASMPVGVDWARALTRGGGR
jgi:hypothetical protein